jgi:hypothetical protein
MSDEKKIIVDEDWKSRVAAEKEEERQQAAKAAAAEPMVSASASAPEGGQPSQLPPASFNMLVTTLATEAMIGLGQLPHPVTQQLHPDPAQARYAIDTLEILSEKTKGNLTPAEKSFLEDVLHQLRMAFVAVSRSPRSAPPAEQPSTSTSQ